MDVCMNIHVATVDDIHITILTDRVTFSNDVYMCMCVVCIYLCVCVRRQWAVTWLRCFPP